MGFVGSDPSRYGAVLTHAAVGTSQEDVGRRGLESPHGGDRFWRPAILLQSVFLGSCRLQSAELRLVPGVCSVV